MDLGPSRRQLNASKVDSGHGPLLSTQISSIDNSLPEIERIIGEFQTTHSQQLYMRSFGMVFGPTSVAGI